MYDLANVLAKLYPEKESFKQVVSRAGLDITRIAAADQPYNFWCNVIEEANKHYGKTYSLMEVALEDYPENQDLLTLKSEPVSYTHLTLPTIYSV